MENRSTPHASFFCNEGRRAIVARSQNLRPRLESESCCQATSWRRTWSWSFFLPMRRHTTGLTKTSKMSWHRRLIHGNQSRREAAGNALKCQMKFGSVLNSYPVRIAVNENQLADVKIRGGVGFVPITFTGLTAPKGYALYIDGDRLSQNVHGNDFWQTDYDAATHRWQQTYNVAFRTGQSHTVHFSLANATND